MAQMRHVWVLAALVALPGIVSGQATSVLHIRAMLLDEAQAPAPVTRHALLISDNPATSTPKRVLTTADGTVDIKLRPGSYTVESDRPVAFAGNAYQWTQIVEIVAGRDATLDLTAQNAEVLPLTASSLKTGAVAPERDALLQIGKWQDSIVAIWSPTSRTSGFLIDARGLIATDRNGVGRATSVEVQLSPTVKVPARVLVSDATWGAAIVWVDPKVFTAASPLPLPCPPAHASPLDEGQEIVTMARWLRGRDEPVRGEVTGLFPRGVDTDMRLSFGGAGGPVFNEAGVVVGLTSIQAASDDRQRSDVTVVRVGTICEAVSAAQSKMPGAMPPEPSRLPVEPTRPYPVDASTTSPNTTGTHTPFLVSSSDFDVAFITPPMLHRERQRPDWTGGRSGRSPEAEARIGQLTDFGAWADYFVDVPAVLIVRVTPKMVEGFWKRVGREAARTQGAVLPAFKDFKTDFLRMRASCGGVEVAPIHPFVIEHHVEKDVIREGLYVFGPDAFGNRCGEMTLSLYSEKAPEKSDTLTIDPKMIDRIWQGFAPYRASGR